MLYDNYPLIEYNNNLLNMNQILTDLDVLK